MSEKGPRGTHPSFEEWRRQKQEEEERERRNPVRRKRAKGRANQKAEDVISRAQSRKRKDPKGDPSNNQEVIFNEAKLAGLGTYIDLLKEDQEALAQDRKAEVKTWAMRYLQQWEPDVDLAQWAETLHRNMGKLREALQRGETVVFRKEGEGISYQSESVHDVFTPSELNSFIHFLFPIDMSTPKDDPNKIDRSKFDNIPFGTVVGLKFSNDS